MKLRGGADVDRRPDGFSRRWGCGVASNESQRHVPFCAASKRAVATATARSARPAGARVARGGDSVVAGPPGRLQRILIWYRIAGGAGDAQRERAPRAGRHVAYP